jgi:hypothetical protein
MQDNRPVAQVGDAALSRTSGSPSTRQSSRYLALNIIIASLIAGLLAGATVALALKLWMMFVGWISFGTGRALMNPFSCAQRLWLGRASPSADWVMLFVTGKTVRHCGCLRTLTDKSVVGVRTDAVRALPRSGF